MSIDWPHMIISMVLIFATVLLVQRTPTYKRGSRGKRAVIVGVAVGLVILVFNLIWPYGKGAGVRIPLKSATDSGGKAAT